SEDPAYGCRSRVNTATGQHLRTPLLNLRGAEVDRFLFALDETHRLRHTRQGAEQGRILPLADQVFLHRGDEVVARWKRLNRIGAVARRAPFASASAPC